MRRTRKKKHTAIINPYELLVRAVCAEYESDECTPSVVLSQLKSGRFYASVVRYRDKFAKDKYRVVAFEAESIDAAVKGLAKEWDAKRNAVRTLHNVVASGWPRYDAFSGGWIP